MVVPASLRPAAIRCGLALMIAAWLGGTVAAYAQDDSGASYWLMERQRQERAQQRARGPIVQRPTHLIRRSAPVKGFARPASELPGNAPAPEAAPSDHAPTPTPADNTAPPAPDTPPAPTEATAPATPPETPAAAQSTTPAQPGAQRQTFTVAVIGDSMGQMLSQGLVDAFADRPDVVILRKARENSGLVRDDYFDWVKGARDLLAGPDRIDMAVMMIGSNDAQPLREGTASSDPLSPRWRQVYAQRVDAIDQAFREKKVPLVWVGAPITKSERLADTLSAVNDMAREAASRTKETFVDVWEAFADERGNYAAYGPDVNGQITRIRAGDGVHFTKAGARKLAHFAEVEIRRALDSTRPAVDPAVAKLAPQLAPADVLIPPPSPALEPQIGRAARPANDLQALLPVPEAAVQPIIPIKPAAGPVVPLTTPVLSPGGQLVTAAKAKAAGEQAVLVEHTLTEGRAVDPRPGRADDFRWPRN